MKVTIQEKSNSEPAFPYFARQGDDVYIFVTGKGRYDNLRTGYMANANNVYPAFSYYSDGWDYKCMTPLRGARIVIDI
jgi:hypothetical protein